MSPFPISANWLLVDEKCQKSILPIETKLATRNRLKRKGGTSENPIALVSTVSTLSTCSPLPRFIVYCGFFATLRCCSF